MENGDGHKEYNSTTYGHDKESLAPEDQISTLSFHNNDLDVETSTLKGNADELSNENYKNVVRESVFTEDSFHDKTNQDDYTKDLNKDMSDNVYGENDSIEVAKCDKSDHDINKEVTKAVKVSNEIGNKDGENQATAGKRQRGIENEHNSKKKKRRCREHNLNCDHESGECPDGRCKDKKEKRKKRRYLKKHSVDLGIENSCFVPDYVSERTSSEEIIQSSPSNGLWLGKELLYKSNTESIQTRENKYLKKCESDLKSNHKHRHGDGDKYPKQNLFIASEFSPRFDNFTHETKTKELSGSIETENSVETYKKRSKIKKKRRLGDLKRTSSKVSIVHGVQPLSTRLEIDPTARTARTQRNRNYLQDGSVTTSPDEFPDPMWFCEIITRFPVISFLVVTIIHLATIGTTVGLVFTGYDIFPAVFDEVPLYIYNDARLKELAWRSRMSFEDAIYRPVYAYNVNTGYRSRVKDTVEIIFEKPGVNILTQQYLKWIKTAEDELYYEKDYREDFCLLDYNDNCLKPQSLLRLFDGTYSHVDTVFKDEEFENVEQVLYKASIYNETKEFLDIFLSKDSVITPHRSYSSITRSVFVMGWPLSILSDGSWGTQQDLTDYLADTFKPKIENIRDYYLVERLDVYYISKLLYEHDLIEQAMKDILLAIGSVIFIFVFMCFQTGSIVLTSLGILSILSSFLLTNIFYRYVFQFKYFGFFHVISLFLILGIGADDLFVFYDTWRLTGHIRYPSDAHRMSDCYRKAAKTTFVTSLTTMMAFLVSGLSPLLPVKTFGIFTGFLVAVNYIWVILYFPSIIMIHHTKTKTLWRRFLRFLLSIYLTSDVLPQNENSPASSDTNSLSETNSSRELLSKTEERNKEKIDNFKHDSKTNADITNKSGVIPNRKPDVAVNIHCSTYDKSQGNAASNINIDHDEHRRNYFRQMSMKPKKNFEDRNRIVKFLRNTFFDIMTKRIVKVTIPLMFFGVAIFFIHRATMIEPDTHQLRLFRSSHNYAKATERHYDSFRRNPDDEYQRLYMVWGILPADISNCDQKSADFCFGETRYDHNINMNTPTAQQAFKDLCTRLDSLDAAVIDKLHIQRNIYTSKPKINCFAGDMERYFMEKGGTDIPSNLNLTLPSNADSVKALMSANRYVYQQPLGDDFENYFEILLSYWLTDGYQLRATNDYFAYNELLPERYVPGVTKNAYYYESGIYYGGKLQFVAIEVNTTMNVYSLGYEEGLQIYNEWENFMESINDMMPAPFNNGIQATENLWHWLHVQETLASSSVTGILVGLFSVWPILVITTMNVIIGTIATVTIGLVTACVIGLIPLAGWKLGVLESINLCMVVGLSVDYIVHLAEAYRMSKSTRRLDRVHDMLESIGLSVISGAITTMGAAMFMLFAQIQFFLQFGIFILSTVGISLLFSLFGFTTLLSLCGPENDTGSLPALIKGLADFCQREKGADSEVDPASSGPSKCPCAPPSVLADRIYDWLSNKTSKDAESVGKKRSRYR